MGKSSNIRLAGWELRCSSFHLFVLKMKVYKQGKRSLFPLTVFVIVSSADHKVGTNEVVKGTGILMYSSCSYYYFQACVLLVKHFSIF